MGLKLLIADPELEWINTAKKFFEDISYEVKEVQNGKDTQLALYNDRFFMVIIGQKLKNHSALQVIRFMKSKHPTQKIIILIEMDTKDSAVSEYIKHGIAENIVTLKKPFSFEQLAQLLEKHQNIHQIIEHTPIREGQSEEEELSLDDTKFTSIPVDDLYSHKAVLFDVFIKLNSDKYVKILHKGDTFSRDRISKYKNDHGVTHLHFLTSDRKKFIQYTNLVLHNASKSEKISGETKIGLLKNVGEKFIEEICVEGMKTQIIDQGKKVCQNITSVIEGQKDLYMLLREFDDFDPNAVGHSFAVTLFATSILKQFNWMSKKTVHSMAMSCMFHDIGKEKLPKEIININPKDLTPEQFEEYKKHPKLSVEAIEGKSGMDSTIKQIVFQHHEFFNGTGFPNGIKGESIFTLSNILAFANNFVHIVADNQCKPIEGLKIILSDKEMVGRFHSQVLENFINVFVDPEKLPKKK